MEYNICADQFSKSAGDGSTAPAQFDSWIQAKSSDAPEWYNLKIVPCATACFAYPSLTRQKKTVGGKLRQQRPHTYESPRKSWNLIRPAVVSASKLGNTSPSRSPGMVGPSLQLRQREVEERSQLGTYDWISRDRVMKPGTGRSKLSYDSVFSNQRQGMECWTCCYMYRCIPNNNDNIWNISYL